MNGDRDVDWQLRGPCLAVTGRPGSGKGTQGELLAARSGLSHISTGELLRDAVRQGTPLGRHVAEFLDRGRLVPANLITELVIERMADPAVRRAGVLLDGYPRTLSQALLLENAGIDLDLVIHIVVPIDEVRARLAERARGDDTPGAITQRLADHEANATPLLAFYASSGRVATVDGVGAVGEVFERVWRAASRVLATMPGRSAVAS